jgi:hypothetical protein
MLAMVAALLAPLAEQWRSRMEGVLERLAHRHARSSFGSPRRKTSARTTASLCSVSRAE